MQKEGDDNYIRLISSKGIARHIPNPNSTLRKQISAEGMDTQISQAFLSVAFFALQRKRQQNYLSKIINTNTRNAVGVQLRWSWLCFFSVCYKR